jgi:hypothetical protein
VWIFTGNKQDIANTRLQVAGRNGIVFGNVRALRWIPMPVDGSMGPPPGLADFQQAWYWNLFWACLKQETAGYLPVTLQLWAVAGAHCRACWEKSNAAVLAAFEAAEMDGTKVIFLPSLVRTIQEQSRKLNAHKPLARGARAADPDQSGFEFSEPASAKSKYTQADFDARDLRLMAKAYDEIAQRNKASVGSHNSLSPKEVFEWVCQRAGISVERGMKLEEMQRKWPQRIATDHDSQERIIKNSR